MLSERRGSLSLRQAAAEARVSFSTFARVEGGSQPDLASFTKLCDWLGVSPSTFFGTVAEKQQSGVDAAVAYLYNDPRLTGANADHIADVLRKLYDALALPPTPEAAVASHLRAARTLRPGAPERLNHILGSLEAELRKRVKAGAI